MTNILTKCQTRTVFDYRKIGVGDIVEYNEHAFKIFRKRVCGIVELVSDDCLRIRERDMFARYETTRRFEFPVERADELRVIFRHPLNEKRR